MTAEPVLAANAWPSNADLIADVARLYIPDGAYIADVTYGRGVWWQKYREPDVRHGLALGAEGHFDDGVDFCLLPEPNNTFDVVAFDPPYVSIGGRTTSTIELPERYGLISAGRTPQDVQEVIDHGLSQVFRVLKPGGRALVKCQDYISSGKLWPGTHLTLVWALSLGFVYEDRFEHVSRPRPQPKRSRQVHARRNLSTLFVFRKPS